MEIIFPVKEGQQMRRDAGMNGEAKDSRILAFLYQTVPGRILLKVLTGRAISKLCGSYLDSPLSRSLISRFVRKYQIPLSDYTEQSFPSFNAFFSRQIKSELRPITEDPESLISPCDGLMSAYRISEGTVLPIKQSTYTVSELLGGDPVSLRYSDGVCLVFRLCVDHYHRYCYLDSGEKGVNIFLPGKLHTVRPVALAEYPVFVQNCREYTVMKTAHFGTVIQVEVGAMLVGKIVNHQAAGSFLRGQEKGLFRYGGSTIVVLLEKNRVFLPEEFFRSTEQGRELPVRMGECIGRSCAVPEILSSEKSAVAVAP